MSHRYLLVMRFALLNLVAFALLAAAYLQGWLDGLFDRTTFILSAIVFAVFLYGLALCGFKVWRTSAALNDMKSGGKTAVARAAQYLGTAKRVDAQTRAGQIGMVRLKMSHEIQIIRQIASMLVFLGLIGTVIGFIIALSGVKPEAVTQVDSVATMVATLIRGMSIALYTTLLGAVLNVWLSINYRLLSSGSVDLLSEIADHGERR